MLRLTMGVHERMKMLRLAFEPGKEERVVHLSNWYQYQELHFETVQGATSVVLEPLETWAGDHMAIAEIEFARMSSASALELAGGLPGAVTSTSCTGASSTHNMDSNCVWVP